MQNGKPIFDQIADFYDETRSEITPDELNAIVSALGSCKTILDVGVGTGRIAKPLQDKGFTVTGLDLSVKMMEKAREKGVKHLVIGNATELPFLDKFFDAFISVHVLHLLEQREKMMSEAARVTKNIIMSLIRESEDNGAGRRRDRRMAWNIYMETREKYGYPLEIKGQNSNHFSENLILEDFPPYRKILIHETEHRTNPQDFSKRFKKSSRYVKLSSDIPEDIHAKILEDVDLSLSQLDLPPRVSKMKEYLCIWRPEDVYDSMERRRINQV